MRTMTIDSVAMAWLESRWMRRVPIVLTLSAALPSAGCASSPAVQEAPPKASPTQRPIRECEEGSGPREVRTRIYLDADHLPVRIVVENDRGVRTETYTRLPTGLLIDRTETFLAKGKLPNDKPVLKALTTFTFGPHGELLMRSDHADGQSRDVTFLWRGRFSKPPEVSTPEWSEGGGATSAMGDDVLPHDLAARNAANPMVAIGFTGSVEATFDGNDRPAVYDYESGLLVHWKGLRGEGAIKWDADRRELREDWTERDLFTQEMRTYAAVSRYETDRAIVSVGRAFEPTSAGGEPQVVQEFERVTDRQGRSIEGRGRGMTEHVEWGACSTDDR